MNYLLATLSHGDPASPTLPLAVASFLEQATPTPAVHVAFHDGPGQVPNIPVSPSIVFQRPIQNGFCKATGFLWRQAIDTAAAFECDYVFWLEHDFTLTRAVDLTQLAQHLEQHPALAQMSLMRNPVSAPEKAAGGLYEYRRQHFSPEGDWLRHRIYFTTTPSLMRTSFMRRNPWPDYERECEGRFGIDLVQHGYSFGVWGDGTPWVQHISERDGSGFGY